MRRTSANIDKLLDGRSIKRVGEYVNNSTRLMWECMVCDHRWHAITTNVINKGSGCPACSNNAKLTNATVDVRLVDTNISRIDSVINATTPITWSCNICMFQWMATPDNILNSKTGCPRCSHTAPLSNDVIDLRLMGSTVVRVSQFTTVSNKTTFQCIVCKHTWITAVTNIIHSNRGCPNCAGNAKLTNQIIDQRLVGRNVNRLDNYVNQQTYLNWECTTCNNIWKASPNNVICHKTGCPLCSKTKQHSSPQLEWLQTISDQSEVDIQTAINGGEYRIPGTRYKADGYCEQTNTIYEFHGDYWHGNPRKYSSDTFNASANKTMGELYTKTLQKENTIRQLGYNLVVMWESEWDNLNKGNNKNGNKKTID